MKIREINVKRDMHQGSEIKHKKKARKRRFWLKLILVFLLLLSLLFVLAISPLCNIKRILVSGIERCSEKGIVASSGLGIGTNALKLMWKSPLGIPVFRFLEAEKRIQSQFAYVRKVRVKYSLDGKVFIDIEERTAIAVIHYQGTSLVIDKDGHVLETAGEDFELKLPAIRGIKSQHFEVGKPLTVDHVEKLDKALAAIKAIKLSDEDDLYKIAERLDWIDVSDLGKLLVSVDSKIVANFGEFSESSYMLNTFKVILKNLKEDDQGLVDFTSGISPIFTPGGLINQKK